MPLENDPIWGEDPDGLDPLFIVVMVWSLLAIAGMAVVARFWPYLFPALCW